MKKPFGSELAESQKLAFDMLNEEDQIRDRHEAAKHRNRIFIISFLALIISIISLIISIIIWLTS